MSRVTVLGGGGVVGSIAAETLASSGVFSEVVIADINIAQANRLVERLGQGNVSASEFDAASPHGIRNAIAGSSVVLNCVGPYYKYGPSILKEVIESKINYVDVCDDLDATEKLLDMDGNARKAGI